MKPMHMLRTHARTLAMGTMLALSVVSLPAVQAHADFRQGQGDFGSCINPSDGQTYYPGERVFSMNGKVMECQMDGSWKVVSEVVVVVGVVRAPIEPHPVAVSVAP